MYTSSDFVICEQLFLISLVKPLYHEWWNPYWKLLIYDEALFNGLINEAIINRYNHQSRSAVLCNLTQSSRLHTIYTMHPVHHYHYYYPSTQWNKRIDNKVLPGRLTGRVVAVQWRTVKDRAEGKVLCCLATTLQWPVKTLLFPFKNR